MNEKIKKKEKNNNNKGKKDIKIKLTDRHESNINNPNKKRETKIKNKNKLKVNTERSSKNLKRTSITERISKNFIRTNKTEKSNKNLKRINKTEKSNKNLNKNKIEIPNKKIIITNCTKSNFLVNKNEKKKEEKDEKEDLNELPFTLALVKDKRNIFKIFISFIIHKFEIINFFYGDEKVKIIIIYEYIFSLLIKFFFNTLLYSDEVVSNKYHNNGNLDFIVSIILSLLSNVITSIICFYINSSGIIEERLELIIEIKKRKYFYIRNIIKFFKYIKLKFFIHIFAQFFIIPFILYYIIVFCIVYSKSRVSLIINYFVSILEDTLISIIISIIITITRKIGIVYLNRYFYNFSKFIDSKF